MEKISNGRPKRTSFVWFDFVIANVCILLSFYRHIAENSTRRCVWVYEWVGYFVYGAFQFSMSLNVTLSNVKLSFTGLQFYNMTVV